MFKQMVNQRFMRFLIAGAINTLFGFAVYSACIVAGLPLWLALMIGTITGTAFNFLTTGGYVFRQLALSRMPRFLLCYALIYTVNLQLLRWVTELLSDKILSQAILVLPIAIFSYLLMARFVFVDVEDSSSRNRRDGP